MNLSSDFKYDAPVDKRKSGSYEWWYFDGADNTGDWHYVIIFYEGCPFSPEYNKKWEDREETKAAEHPAISISLYHKGAPVFYCMSEYNEKDASFKKVNENEIKIRVGENKAHLKLEDDMLNHTIQISERLPSGDELSGTLRFQSKLLSSLFKQSGKDVSHSWNLTQPRAGTKVQLFLKEAGKDAREISFMGTGYHDHNTGAEPMKNEFRDWYWGRFHFKDSTLVYYLMPLENGYQFRGWLIDVEGNLLEEIDGGSLNNSNINLFNFKCANKIDLSSKNYSIAIDQTQTLDSGPFYYRFKSTAELKKGSEISDKAVGISEYIYPERIHHKIYWPLVKMRYHYVGSPHWVQKSSFFYRWTW